MSDPKSGNVFLLKVGNGQSPETFTTIDALRATAMSINGESVDTTNKDAAGWRGLLPGGGLKSITITADGIYKATDAQKALRTAAMQGVIKNYQIDDGDDVVEGAFQVTSFDHDGPLNDVQSYSVTLESADVPTIAPVAGS